MSGRLAFALLIGLLLLPPASAAPAPLEAELAVTGPVTLDGEANLTSGRGILDLNASAREGTPLRLTWSRADGYFYNRTAILEFYTKGNEDLARNVTPIHLGPGGLDQVVCDAACHFFVFADGGEVGWSGLASDALAWSGGPGALWYPWDKAGPEEPFALHSESGALNATATAHEGTRLEGGRPWASGRVGVFLWNAELRLEDNGQTQPLDLRRRSERIEALAFFNPPERVETKFLLLYAEGAWLDAPEGAPGWASLPEPTVSVSGALDAARATGWLRYGGQLEHVRDERVLLEGLLTSGVDVDRTRLGQVGLHEIAARQRTTHVLQGDVERVVVGGAPVEPALSSSAGAVAAAGGILLLAGVAWLLFERGVFAVLYSRIGRAQVLENENRRALYDIVRAEPGLPLGDLSRRVGVSRIVARNHLRRLQAHRLVTARHQGRSMWFFPADAAPDPVTHKQALALQDETRRKVAAALTDAEAPVSQRDLMDATGLSQRLVSYHLTRLEKAGLVQGEGALPRRYRPTDELRAALPASGA